MTPALRLVEVEKSFGEFVALRRVSLEVGAGEVVALLGHNGAGKSVTVRLIATLAWPTSGQVVVDGYDTRRQSVEVRRRLGACLDQPMLWSDLTGAQTLRLLGEAYELPSGAAERRAGEILERFRFTLPADKRVREYSLGMKRKLALAASLVHEPGVVLWDEPEIGLDAPSRVILKELIRDLAARGRAVLVTTHAIEVAQAVADRVAVLCQGRLVDCDTPAALRARRGADASLEQAFMALIEDGHRADAGAEGPAS